MNNSLFRVFHIRRKLELFRYRILAKDSVIAKLYRALITLCYPIFGSKLFLSSTIVNYRNREGVSLYDLVKNSSLGDKKLQKDLVLCYYFYHIVPWEYQLYNFDKQNHKKRLCWLSDTDRFMCCELLMGIEPYTILKDKYKFYQLLKDFYQRPIMSFTNETTEEELRNFVEECNGSIFVKPINGSLGVGAFKIESTFDNENLFSKLRNLKGNWILEGSIIQSSLFEKWNSSSVNTIRIPSICRNGEWHILQPFLRTGRSGQIVDNAGAGGILCVVDTASGIVETDGYDEYSNVYKYHPDSQMQFKGWQVPYYNELLELTEKIHKSLPQNFFYVGFDFALTTDKGWDLIEGNWGQFIGQIAAQKGIKKQFDSYMHIC